MREFKYGVGVIAQKFLLNLLLVKMSEKSLTKADFRSKNQKDMSDDGNRIGWISNSYQKTFKRNEITSYKEPPTLKIWGFLSNSDFLPRNTVVPRFSIHRFSRNPDLVEKFAVTNHFYSIKLQYSRNFNLVDWYFCCSIIFTWRNVALRLLTP